MSLLLIAKPSNLTISGHLFLGNTSSDNKHFFTRKISATSLFGGEGRCCTSFHLHGDAKDSCSNKGLSFEEP